MRIKCKNEIRSSEKNSLSVFFHIEGEMKENNGEDSYFFYADSERVILSVFDGCGGTGSRRYANFSGKTGAFVASRAVCGAVKSWVEDDDANPDALELDIKRALNVCEAFADKGNRLMGTLGKDFPTTAAIAVINTYERFADAKCFWAGDSRCYMLNNKGLHQLTDDDVENKDAFVNLSDDGVLKNVISANSSFKLNHKTVRADFSCIFLTATDGCFGYLSSPMEFEYLLIDSLMSAENIDSWRKMLNESVAKFAGDDYSMGVAAFGFDSFDEVKEYFTARKKELDFFCRTSEKSIEEKWDWYKKEYYSL